MTHKSNKVYPDVAFDDAMRKLQLSVAALVNNPAQNTAKSVGELADSITRSNQEMRLAISKSMPKIVFPSTTLYIPRLPVTHAAPKIELVGGSDLKVTGDILTTEPKKTATKKQFSLYFIKGDSVKYKRKTLKALSLETQHGRLLRMLLDAEGHFVSDEELLKTFNKDVVHDASHILRNLKDAFKVNNMLIIIERRKINKGYVLVDIQPYNLTD